MEENKNVFVYIRGVEGRGHEVMDTLVKLGGVNSRKLDGEFSDRIYYIAPSGTIVYVCFYCYNQIAMIRSRYTEIFLPKEV